jgi:hypothetical protein
MCILLCPLKLHGQRVEAGVISSVRSAGICVDIIGRQDNISSVRVYADLYKVLNGRYYAPGLKVDYHLLFDLLEHDFQSGATMSLRAGPGAITGIVRDTGKERGVLAGLSGMACAQFGFGRFGISLGFSAVLGYHIHTENRYENTLKFYSNGISRACIPELCIKYGF